MPTLAQACSLISPVALADWSQEFPHTSLHSVKRNPARESNEKWGKEKRDVKRINVVFFRCFFAKCHLEARVSCAEAVLSGLLAYHQEWKNAYESCSFFRLALWSRMEIRRFLIMVRPCFPSLLPWKWAEWEQEHKGISEELNAFQMYQNWH